MKKLILKWLGLDNIMEILESNMKRIDTRDDVAELKKTVEAMKLIIGEDAKNDGYGPTGLMGMFKRDLENMMFGDAFKPLTHNGRIAAVEKKIGRIMSYLNVELHTEAEKTYIRKKKK